MGRFTIFLLICGLWGVSESIAKANCCFPPYLGCCIAQPIIIQSCPPVHCCQKPCCPPPPCDQASYFVGRRGVIYIEPERQGFVAIDIRGQVEHHNIVHLKTDIGFDYYRENPVHPIHPPNHYEWAVSRIPVADCRHSVFFRIAGQQWNLVHHAVRDCVKAGARPVAVSASPNSSSLARTINMDSKGSTEIPGEVVQPFVASIKPLAEMELHSYRPSFQPPRNRIIVKAGYSLTTSVAQNVGQDEAPANQESRLVAIQAP